MQIRKWWGEIRDSLWFLPALFTVGAIGAAVALVHADESLVGMGRISYGVLFSGGPEAARAILSVIAGSIITVTGVVFSITIVAIQLASSQYTPRVLRNFMADRANQWVLAIFIGTFAYSLMVLRRIRFPGEQATLFVPSLAVTGALLLALVSIGFLIFFVNHAARSMQASTIIDRVTGDTLRRIEHLFPDPVGEAIEEPAEAVVPDAEPARVAAQESGYLQAVDEGALSDLAERGRLVVRMEVSIGAFVLPGDALASVWPAGALDEAMGDDVRGAFVLGHQRTPDQDVEFGVIELVDIALKALSPAVNDPTTALMAIDRLGQILVTFGNRSPPRLARAAGAGDGPIRFVARRTEYTHVVGMAFDQLARAVDGKVAVARRLLETLGRVAEKVPPHRRPPLMKQAEAVVRSATLTLHDRVDLDAVEAAAASARARARIE